MRAHRILTAAVVAVSLAAAACSGSSTAPFLPTGSTAGSTAGATSPANSPATPPATQASTSQGAPTQSAALNGFYLRSWNVGASDPAGLYFAVPEVISDGQVKYLPEVPWVDNQPTLIYTAPIARSISPAGQAAIVALAQADGLLGDASTFDCPPSASGEPSIGGGVPNFELKVNGVSHFISGSCDLEGPSPAAASPAPGTWAAFNDFATHIYNLSGWLGAELGPETPFEPTALMVWTAPPADAWWGPYEPDPKAASRPWPLSTPLASFGNPVHWSGAVLADPSRCVLLTGPDVHTLLAGVQGANDDTRFTDGTTTKVVAVSVVMPGEPTDTLCGE
ncbi:MAG: hypothetical protein ABSD62_05900 [Candidatus Limnocylindrales bacterium]|jgi:hypothetical protein